LITKCFSCFFVQKYSYKIDSVEQEPDPAEPAGPKMNCKYAAFKDWAMLSFLNAMVEMPARGKRQISAPDYESLFKSYLEGCPLSVQVMQGTFRHYCIRLLIEENVEVRK
jgi:hypothetical protein